ncbi:MAG TPA: serine/threonine-protein kinase, partial [Planctomycetota bacterium]|nr:serine/threonine-protein kinase [Planctomycetota bacterium]
MDRNNPQETQPIQPNLSAETFRPVPADQKYQIEKKIAEGGMGVILSALDKNIQRRVAMKIISADQSDNQDHISRFIEEVQITGQLEHPNIVPTYELGTGPDGNVYYTMKLVKGKTLDDILEKLKAKKSFSKTVGYTLPKLLQIFVQICNGIAFAHSKGVIHRDLKPENIMIGEFGEVFIMDWGLAKVLGKAERPAKDTVKGVRESSLGTRTMDGTVMGTPSYMPPEQARGEIDNIDQRSDVYGLGAILYQILTFAPPFTGNDVHKVLSDVVNKPVIPPRKRAVADIPKELDAICLMALAKDQSGRYASAQELA